MKYAVEPSLIPKIKSEYIQGRGSVREICDRYGVGETRAMEVRASKEKWTQQRESHLNAICEKTMETALSEAEEWQRMVSKRVLKDWKFVDKSIDLLCAEDSEGNPITGIDPDAIAGYYRARKLMDDMARRSMGLSDNINFDLKSDGKDIGTSIVDALAKLRANPQPYKPLTSEEMKLAIECEIVPDNEV